MSYFRRLVRSIRSSSSFGQQQPPATSSRRSTTLPTTTLEQDKHIGGGAAKSVLDSNDLNANSFDSFDSSAESLASHSALLDYMPVPVLLINLEGYVTFVNRAGLDWLESAKQWLPQGFERGVGVAYCDFYKNSEDVRAVLAAVNATNSTETSSQNRLPYHAELDIGSEMLQSSLFPVQAVQAVQASSGKLLGVMAVWKNLTREKNQERWDKMVLEQLRTSTEGLSEATDGLKRIYDSIITTSQDTSETAQDVLSAVNDVGERVRGVAANIEENSASISSIAQSVGHTAHVVSEAAREVSEVEGVITKLSDVMANVSEMITSIQRVMTQTRMLAINAGIEAARAGASGTGFGVIASEIGRLSEQTGKVTRDITAMTSEMLVQIPLSVQGMQRVRSVIDDIHAMTTSVNVAVQQQEQSMLDMTNLMQEATRSTEQVLMGMATVSHLSTATADFIKTGQASVAEIDDTHDTFSIIVQRFGKYLVITPDDSFRLIIMISGMLRALLHHRFPAERQEEIYAVAMKSFSGKQPADAFAKTVETITEFLRMTNMPEATIHLPKGAVTPTQVYAVLLEFVEVVEFTLVTYQIMTPDLKRAKPVIGKKPDDVFAAMDMVQRLVALLPGVLKR